MTLLRKNIVIISLILLSIFFLSVSCNMLSQGILHEIMLCKDIDLSVDPPQPVNETKEFSLGDEKIILYLWFINKSDRDWITILLIDPLGKICANLSFPLGRNRPIIHNWTICWIEFPIRGSIHARVYVKTSSGDFIKWSYILDTTISSIGEWTTLVKIYSKTYRVKFILRQLILKLSILNDFNEIIPNTLIKITSGPFSTSIFSKYGNASLQIAPGVYNISIRYYNKTITSFTLNIARDTFLKIVVRIYKLRIKVLSHNGKPLRTAQISLYRGNSEIYSGTTDGQGIFITDFLPHDTYEIRILWINKIVYEGLVNLNRNLNITIKTRVYEISIRAVGEQQQPLIHAKILCREMNITRYTSSTGIAYIGLLPEGNYTFDIQYKDVKKQFNVNVNNDKIISIVLPVFIELLDYTISKQLFLFFLFGVIILVLGLIIFTYIVKVTKRYVKK